MLENLPITAVPVLLIAMLVMRARLPAGAVFADTGIGF